MTTKDLTQFLKPNLDLPVGGHVYSVRPPTRDVGLRLATIVSVGVATYHQVTDQCAACGRTGAADIPQESQDLMDEMKSTNLASLSLGEDIVAEMTANGVPEVHQDQLAQYAMYYWVLGEQAADLSFQNQYGSQAVDPSPKARKSGRSTASGSRTSSASTRSTGPRPN